MLGACLDQPAFRGLSLDDDTGVATVVLATRSSAVAVRSPKVMRALVALWEHDFRVLKRARRLDLRVKRLAVAQRGLSREGRSGGRRRLTRRFAVAVRGPTRSSCEDPHPPLAFPAGSGWRLAAARRCARLRFVVLAPAGVA